VNAKVVIREIDAVMLRRHSYILSSGGYTCVSIETNAPVLQIIAEQHPDLLVLDDPTLCPPIRKQWPHLPLLVLVTPGSVQEIALARIRAHLRRAQMSRQALADEAAERISSRDGFVSLEVPRRLIHIGGRAVRLTAKECGLLRKFLRHEGQVLSHQMLLQRVWGPGYGDAISDLRVFVRQLRQKVEPDPSHPRYLLTAAGIGYVFRSSEPGER
jgi:two-component system KDP operon response regulator KdpE